MGWRSAHWAVRVSRLHRSRSAETSSAGPPTARPRSGCWMRSSTPASTSSTRPAEALEACRRHGLPRYECLQPHYNLYVREGYEAELEPLCRREELGVI